MARLELFARKTVLVLGAPEAAPLPPALPSGVSTFPLLHGSNTQAISPSSSCAEPQ